MIPGSYDISQFLFVFVLLVVFPCAVWGIYALLSPKKVTLTGHATVKSHQIWRDSCWTCLVCFEFSDGSELELRTVKGDYQALTDGQSGQLTWEDDLLLHFEPDPTPLRR